MRTYSRKTGGDQESFGKLGPPTVGGEVVQPRCGMACNAGIALGAAFGCPAPLAGIIYIGFGLGLG